MLWEEAESMVIVAGKISLLRIGAALATTAAAVAATVGIKQILLRGRRRDDVIALCQRGHGQDAEEHDQGQKQENDTFLHA